MIMKLDQFHCCRVLFTVLAKTVHKTYTIVVYLIPRNKTCWLRNSSIVYERKAKDCARSWNF